MNTKTDFAGLVTEGVNSRSESLDILATEDAVLLMNDMDAEVAAAVRKAAPEITICIDHIKKAFRAGGRLIYCGAGTSGRLGVLDASECPPTFGVSPEMVKGIIAGGDFALRNAIEGAEDSPESGAADMRKLGLNEKDVLVAISASGYAPYCVGALDYARSIGAYTGAVVCVPDSNLSRHADVTMASVVGPEILSGSTRLRAGTATKMTLNMLTTLSMVGIGKVYKNLMVDVKANNTKLHARTVRIVRTATGVSEREAAEALAETAKAGVPENPKIAITMILTGADAQAAAMALEEAGGFVRGAVEKLNGKG